MKLLLVVTLSFSSLFAATLAPSTLPPSGLAPENTPLFIVIGSDDNYGSGMPRFLDYCETKTNPGGIGQDATYDGKPIAMSWYSNTTYNYIYGWMDWHTRAVDMGHELGLHTHSHPNISSTTEAVRELEENLSLMCDNSTLTRDLFVGFRSPFLSVSNHVFNALGTFGLLYDCSIEEGMEPEATSVDHFTWPYTLDEGMTPSYRHLYDQGVLRDTLEKHPGVWELPAYPLFYIPDSLYAQYGVGAGYDNQQPDINEYRFGEIQESIDGKKMTGLDYDAWFLQEWDGSDLAATLLYNLELRLEGNRVPLTFGIHSNYYGADYYNSSTGKTGDNYLAGMTDFLDTALTYPDVRVVSAKQLLDWMMNPVGLDGTVGEVEDTSDISDTSDTTDVVDTTVTDTTVTDTGDTTDTDPVDSNDIDTSVVDSSDLTSLTQFRHATVQKQVTLTGRALTIANLGKSTSYTLFSADGRALLSGRVQNHSVIDVGTLSCGVYLLQLAVDGAVSAHRFVVK